MNTKEIWMLPKEERLPAFLERYLELDEFTGNRTLQEKAEMAEIADAVMPALIQFVARSRSLIDKWRPLATSTIEDMERFTRKESNQVPMAATYGMCLVELEMLIETLDGKKATNEENP